MVAHVIHQHRGWLYVYLALVLSTDRQIINQVTSSILSTSALAPQVLRIWLLGSVIIFDGLRVRAILFNKLLYPIKFIIGWLRNIHYLFNNILPCEIFCLRWWYQCIITQSRSPTKHHLRTHHLCWPMHILIHSLQELLLAMRLPTLHYSDFAIMTAVVPLLDHLHVGTAWNILCDTFIIQGISVSNITVINKSTSACTRIRTGKKTVRRGGLDGMWSD